MRKISLIVLFYFILTITVFSERSYCRNNIECEEDSTFSVYKLKYSANCILTDKDYYSFADIDYGYGIEFGFMISFMEELDLECSLAIDKYKLSFNTPGWDWKLNSHHSYLGLRVYPYRDNFSFFLGGGISIDTYNEEGIYKPNDWEKKHDDSYYSCVAKIGTGYRLSNIFVLDANSSFRFNQTKSNVMINLGIIYEIR